MNSVRILVPVALAILAGGINFVVLKKSSSTLDLVVVKEKVKAGTPITEDMLGRISLRADQAVFKTAIPYSERSLLLRRQVARDLQEGEAVLYSDLRAEIDDVRGQLKPNESSLTLIVKAGRIAAGVGAGDQVMFLVGGARNQTDTNGRGARLLGPFRVLALADRAENAPVASGAPDEPRKLIVAVTAMPDGQLDQRAQQLEEAARGDAPAIQAVEFYRPGVAQ